MYCKTKIENNLVALELMRQRKKVMDQISDLRTQVYKLENKLIDAIDGFKKGEVVRDTTDGKEYVVRNTKLLWCDEQEANVSYIIHPMKKNGEVSKNECHKQIGERVERTGKTTN